MLAGLGFEDDEGKALFAQQEEVDLAVARVFEVIPEGVDLRSGARRERLIGRMIYAPPPASKGTVLKSVYRPLDEREQSEFRQFAERLKREFRRRGTIAESNPLSLQEGGGAPKSKVPDAFYSPTDIANAINAPEKARAIRMALKRLFDQHMLPGGAWLENSDPAKGQAKILYRLDAVRPFLNKYQPPSAT